MFLFRLGKAKSVRVFCGAKKSLLGIRVIRPKQTANRRVIFAILGGDEGLKEGLKAIHARYQVHIPRNKYLGMVKVLQNQLVPSIELSAVIAGPQKIWGTKFFFFFFF